MKITQKRLKELLDYNGLKGVFTWLVNKGRAGKIGNQAGTLHHQGYIQIKLDGKIYSGHRLAWLYTYGYFPEHDIDHINRIRDDNRICNLRVVSKSCNSINSKVPSDNTSGVKGVSLIKNTGFWKVSLECIGKNIKPSNHKNFKDAVMARWVLEKEHGFSECDSKSSAFLYLRENKLI